MKDVRRTNRPLMKSVLIVAATMIAVYASTWIAVFVFDHTPPESAGTITGLISTLAGVGWFAWKVNRRMLHSERLRFAFGVVVVNVVVSISYFAALLLWAGLPVSPAGADIAFGDGKGYLLEADFAWFLVFGLALVFAQAYFFAWLLTRKLTKAAEAST